jgi:hypothetical protein
MPDPRMRRASGALDAAKPVLLALALLAVAIAMQNGLLTLLGRNAPLSFTLAGSFALYLATRPARNELVVTLLLALALRLLYGAAFGVQPYFGSVVICFAGFLGLASLMVLAYTALRNKRFAEFGTAAYFPFVSIMVGFILPIGNRLSPVTFDVNLLAADGTLGYQPSFVLGSMIARHPLLWNLTSIVYYALPFAVALLCAARLKEDPLQVRRLLWLFGTLSVAGFSLYTVCPATGPAYAFHDLFPWKPPHLADLALGVALSVPGAPRNAMPSLHFSAALLVFWNTSRLGKASRILAGLFLAATAFAILALGEHYVIDIIVAVPFCLLFQAAFMGRGAGNARARYFAMLGGAAVAAAWMLTLRFGIQSLVAWPAATRASFLVTLGISIWARYALFPTSSQVRDPATHL